MGNGWKIIHCYAKCVTLCPPLYITNTNTLTSPSTSFLLPLLPLPILSPPPPLPPFYSTLEQRAKRLFLTKGVPLGALDPSHFAKTKSAVQEAESHREIAQMEAMVYKYSELLSVIAVQDFLPFMLTDHLPPCIPPLSLYRSSELPP